MSIHVNVPDLSVNMPPEGMMMVTLFKSYPVKSWKVRHYELPFKRLGPISHHTGDRLEVGGDGHDIVWSVFVHRLQHSFPWPFLTLCWQNDLLTRYWLLTPVNSVSFTNNTVNLFTSPSIGLRKPPRWNIVLLCRDIFLSNKLGNSQLSNCQHLYLGGRVFLLFLIIASINLWVCKTPFGLPCAIRKFNFQSTHFQQKLLTVVPLVQRTTIVSSGPTSC